MKIGKEINHGSYGIVYNVNLNGDNYVLKRNIGNSGTGINCLKELNFFKQFKHPHISGISYIFTGKNLPNIDIKHHDNNTAIKDDKIHLVFNKAFYDLHDTLATNEINYCDIPILMYQVLTALEYIHLNKYMHLDIKPNNILVYIDEHKKKHFQICDFGECRPYYKNAKTFSDIVTCIYRAPEICEEKSYNYKVDIWAFACIIYECFFDRFIEESSDYNGHTEKAINDLMLKNIKYHNKILSKNALENLQAQMQEKYSEEDIVRIDENLNGLDSFLDLFVNLLCIDPDKRYSATEALNHNFFDNYRKEITNLRDNYKIKKYTPVGHVIFSNEIIEFITLIYNNRKSLDIYNDLNFFHGIRIFREYLLHENTATDEVTADTGASDKISLNEISIFLICYYISYKFFVYRNIDCDFNDFCDCISINIEIDLPRIPVNAVENLDYYIIQDILKFNIYIPCELEQDQHISLDKIFEQIFH